MILLLLGDEDVDTVRFEAAELVARRVGENYMILKDRFGLTGKLVTATRFHEALGHRMAIMQTIQERVNACEPYPPSPTIASSSGT